MTKITQRSYTGLIANISGMIEQGKERVYSSVNSILLGTYWEIGRLIVEYEQKGKEKAEYGIVLIKKLSKDLKLKYNKGFSMSNLYLIRLFYTKYPKLHFEPGIFQTSGKFQIKTVNKLTWSHYVELLSVSDDLTRSFYEKECVNANWSVRELRRQIDSMLFERLALSKDKKAILQLAQHGQIIKEEKDILKEPYMLEFLGLPERESYSEKELEQKIIDNLQMFLLELGKGFTFVKRQFRITLNNTNFYIDLVFYNRILKCFVLIDLKIGRVSHADIGQMNMYLNYFRHEENIKGDNHPIGIILAADKDDIMIEYALGGISNKLFVSRYKLYLPEKQKLEEEVRKMMGNR